MNDLLVQIGSGISVLLGVFHFATTKPALARYETLGMDRDTHRMLVAMWNALGFMVVYVGAIPLTLTLLDAYGGVCATVVGGAATAFVGLLAVSHFMTQWTTKNTPAKAMTFVFAAIAALIGVGTFVRF
jgi:hypothetical protein